MTFSPLITGIVPHHGKMGSRKGKSVRRVIQHHWAGLGGGDKRLLDPAQPASTTYIIYTDGRIDGQVPEEFRPWTSGSDVDEDAITFEVQNSGGPINGNGPDSHPASWPISDAAYNSLIILLADIARRHEFPAIDENTYQGHRQHYSTACPGGYLWARMANTRAAATVILNSGNAAQGPSEEDDMFSDDDRTKLLKVLDDSHRVRGVVDSVEEPLHESLLRINRFIKSPGDDTVYELVGGKLRPLSALEWKLIGKNGVDKIVPQSDIDAMPKLPLVS